MCLRDYYIDCLKDIQPYDDAERAVIASSVAWVEGGGPLYRRHKVGTPENERHFVCYFPLLDMSNKSIFLGLHKKAQLWLPPGGHIEEGETPEEATIRECREELGIPARFLDSKPLFASSVLTQNLPDPHTDVAFWFVLISASQETITIDKNEFSDSRWFDIDQPFPPNTEPNMARFIAKLKHTSAYSVDANSKELAKRVTFPALMAS